MANTYSALVPEIWSKEVLLGRNAAQVIAPTVTKPAETEISEGDTVHFPVFSAFTVGNALDDGNDNTLSNRSFSTIDLLIDKHKFAGAHYTDKELKQIAKNARYEQQEQQLMGAGLMEQIELDLYNEMVAGASATVLGSQGSGLTDAVLKDIVEQFDAAKTPAEDRFLVIPVAGKRDLLGIDKFVKANEGGTIGAALLARSEVGKNFVAQLYGLNVIWSTVIGTNAGSPSGHTAVAYHGNSVGLALQKDVNVKSDYIVRKIGTDVVADTLYGVKVLRQADVFKVLI